MCLTTFFITHVAKADELTSPPLTFESHLSLEEITRQIEDYYSTSLLRSNNKWKDSVVKHDGAVGQYITTYFWISGSNIGYDIVGQAQRKAIESKYGKVEKNILTKWKQHNISIKQIIKHKATSQ